MTAILFSGISVPSSGGRVSLTSLLGHTNSNAMGLINFTAARNVIIFSTGFQHFNMCKANLLSSDRSATNQISAVQAWSSYNFHKTHLPIDPCVGWFLSVLVCLLFTFNQMSLILLLSSIAGH